MKKIFGKYDQTFRIDEDDSIRGKKTVQGIGLQGSYVRYFAVLS